MYNHADGSGDDRKTFPKVLIQTVIVTLLMQRKKKGSEKLLGIIAWISVLALIVCVFLLVRYEKNSNDSRNNIKKIKDLGASDVLIPISVNNKDTEGDESFFDAPGFASYEEYMNSLSESSEGTDYLSDLPVAIDKLNSLNPDLFGWINIDGTMIDYPVMFTPSDPEFYLHKNFFKEYDKEGLPFIDHRCDPKKPSSNVIIYGHNMKNGDMFADMLKFTSKDYYEKHKTIRLNTIYETGEFEIVSVFRSKVYEEGEEGYRFYNFIDPVSEGEASDFIAYIKKASLYETGIEPLLTDTFITLITCEYTVDNGRFVIVAVKNK